jgi:hypothetical protein
VAEHVLDMMDWPAGLEPATAGLVSRILEVQIDRAKSFSRLLREPPWPGGYLAAGDYVEIQNAEDAARRPKFCWRVCRLCVKSFNQRRALARGSV